MGKKVVRVGKGGGRKPVQLLSEAPEGRYEELLAEARAYTKPEHERVEKAREAEIVAILLGKGLSVAEVVRWCAEREVPSATVRFVRKIRKAGGGGDSAAPKTEPVKTRSSGRAGGFEA